MLCLTVLLTCALAAPLPQWASVRLQQALEPSIRHSLPQQGAALAAQISRLLRWRGDVHRRLHRDDHLNLLWAHNPPPPGEPSDAGEPELLALDYAGQQLQLRAYRFVGADGIGRYYTAAGERVEPRLHNAPVPRYVQITDTVQGRRRGRRRHHGIDLKAAAGEPVITPFAGTIRRLNWARRHNGRCVEIQFDDGRIGRFLHLQRLQKALRRGQYLLAHSPLGCVGSTGHSGAPHLHYELWGGGAPQEPLRAPGHGSSAARLPETELAAFAIQRDAYDRALLGPAAAHKGWAAGAEAW